MPYGPSRRVSEELYFETVVLPSSRSLSTTTHEATQVYRCPGKESDGDCPRCYSGENDTLRRAPIEQPSDPAWRSTPGPASPLEERRVC